jgi:hypothetical protein
MYKKYIGKTIIQKAKFGMQIIYKVGILALSDSVFTSPFKYLI